MCSSLISLKKGWQYVYHSEDEINLETAKKINNIVTLTESLEHGKVRKGAFSTTIKEIVSNDNLSLTVRAIKLMYGCMKSQIFFDGNKRTATLLANKVMIDNGLGLINIPLDKWNEWNELLSDFYLSGDDTEIVQWTYDNAIFGIEF